MRIELTEIAWLEEHELSQRELAQLSGLPPRLLGELVHCGAIAPLPPTGKSRQPRFSAAALSAARHARRLRDDFELDVQGLLLALGLLERVRELETELRQLRARAPRQ